MFLNREKLALTYLTNNGLTFYSGQDNQSFNLNFPKEVVDEMEIKNKQALIALLEDFIIRNKISSVTMMMLISPQLCFSHDFAYDDPKTLEETQFFVESVPFENTAVIYIDKEKMTTVIVTNKDLYSVVGEMFSKHGSILTNVTPRAVLPNLGLKDAADFDQIVAKFVLNNYAQTKNYNFQYEGKQIATTPVIDTVSVKKKSNKQLYILIGIFMFLGLVLILLVMFR